MLNLDLTGAEILGRAGLHRDGLSFADGVIVDAPVGRAVDLSGYLVLPGIVDVHGDGFERHLAPRRGAMKDMAEGLIAVEAELAANGITTATLAQFISWEGGVRGLEFAEEVFSHLRDVAPKMVTDLRGQLRFETYQLELYDELPAKMDEWGLRYIVFNDHLPHDRLKEGRQPRRLVSQALKARRSPENHLALMQSLESYADEVPSALDWLCGQLGQRGIAMGSHDDATAPQRAAWAKRGVNVAEFPETLEAAEAAKEGGGIVVMGSPNVVRGGSHNLNVSAVDLIAMGYCDALASDYHYPSARRAALMLWQNGMLDLAGAWSLVSAGPAAVLGLSDRGTLEAGKRADMVVLDRDSLRVAATLVQGRVSYMSGDIAARFMG
ncbi:alpha-D-ribose 1-methylphosphonate 5-triphosphate diphosphatase [Sulfitobacter donghicola]|uniref:Phosphonate metabolism protein PhnM n=1 Tax=Sulfitobacter donghicola DSW-25 = KCTC 12864 = JCM 14565 TaxID=1300350 RepID=A0A073IH35_9RHOB|nr:alpha-D-ribose 1-methylphosphonate 5-triphosphate diphosphatase [Sulfitobacter donghicola]KEJ88831.1 phosphonate metabolism protein PhnM [Sulfitobacter donghicola DSW-25 = KCTC 12864 = JCM 14565]KIN68627.1 PhnM-like protein [Sulfitobacter donghicola DSW-25 = KCTC 12864 = JCM 14565]